MKDITREQVLDALQTHKTVEKAAKALGLTFIAMQLYLQEYGVEYKYNRERDETTADIKDYMETREQILLAKAREIAGREAIANGSMTFVEALVTMGRWCDANPNISNEDQGKSAGRSMSSHEVARRLLALPNKQCMTGSMDDFGAYGLYIINQVKEDGKYIVIGE